MSKSAVIEKPEATLVVAPAYNPGFNAEDFHIPRLNCIHKMSTIEGNPGDIVLDRRATIVKPGKKLPVTVVSIQKAWTEKVPYDSEVHAQTANTIEEAQDLKINSQYPIVPKADIIVLLPHNNDLNGIDEETASEMFPYLIDDVAYQLGRLTVQSFAYDHTFKIVNSFHLGNPAINLQDMQWNFSSLMLERGKYSWYVPVLGRAAAKTPTAIKSFLGRLVGGAA